MRCNLDDVLLGEFEPQKTQTFLNVFYARNADDLATSEGGMSTHQWLCVLVFVRRKRNNNNNVSTQASCEFLKKDALLDRKQRC